MNRTMALALTTDVVAVLVFAAVGRASHGEPADLLGVLATAAPFLVGVAVGWLGGVVRRAPVTFRAGGVVLAASLVVGLVGRAIITGRLPVTFVLVTAVTLSVLLLGWRAVALAVARSRASAGR